MTEVTSTGTTPNIQPLFAAHGHQNSAAKGLAKKQPQSPPAVNVSLSEEAQALLENDHPGKSGNSVAHRARAALASEEFSSLSNLPFGKIVSALARDIDLSTLLPPADEPVDTAPGEPANDNVDETDNNDTTPSITDITADTQSLSAEQQALSLLINENEVQI